MRSMLGDLPYRPGMDRRRFLLTSLAGSLAVPPAAQAQAEGDCRESSP
jgi:hypothetical protein